MDAIREVRALLRRFDGVGGSVDTEQHLRVIDAHVHAIQTDRRIGAEAPERFRLIQIAAHAIAMIEPES